MRGVRECLRSGPPMNIVRSAGGMLNCFRMAPPLSVTEDEIDTAVSIMDQALTSMVRSELASGTLAVSS